MATTTEPRRFFPGLAAPGGRDGQAAVLAGTTDLAVVAHPDDIELIALPGIAACRLDPDRSFTGVVCTDGAGSAPSPGASEIASPGELVERRWAEQCRAATIGGYGAVIGLVHPSADVLTPEGSEVLVEELFDLAEQCRPANVYTHNPADKHPTHVAVVAATIKALRRLPSGSRPHRIIGVEAWRDLDWLPDDEKVRLDVSEHGALGLELLGTFESQLEAKRYDLAASGRRRANATFASPRHPDDATEVVVAWDLSALVHNADLDPVRFVDATVDRFRREAVEGWGRWFPG